MPELASYLDRVEIAEPIGYRGLAVYPVLLEREVDLGGRWLTLDEALARGALVVTEKGGGSVPVVLVENRGHDEHVLILSGEVLSGGKQTRTIRQDVIVAPGQRVELSVFCVEAHRWEGGGTFSAGQLMVPPSIQLALRRGTDQETIWAEVARNNAALRAENPTGSLELAMKSAPVRERLDEVRRAMVPNLPRGTMGFLFLHRGRALGAECFGREHLARALFPKLLDSYAVDCVVLASGDADSAWRHDHRPAIEFFERVCRAGSDRAATPGTGAGIRTRAGDLFGNGVSLGGTLVHYGVQATHRIVPMPLPPPRIWPPRRE